MTLGRIPVELTLMGQLRNLAAKGGFYTVLRRGDPHTGVILLIWRRREGVTVYAQQRTIDDVLAWQEIRVEPSGPQGYITRAGDRDPDLWVIEVETTTSDFPLEGPVIHA